MGSVSFRAKLRMVRNSRNRTFQKNAILATFCALFWPPFLEALFLTWCSSGLLQKCRRGGRTRNATKQWGSDRFRVYLARRLLLCWSKLRFCGPNLTTISSACYYFLLSEVRFFDEIGFWGSKTRWGCRAEVVFKSVFFCVVSGARANLTRGKRAGVTISCRVWCGSQNGLAAVVRRVFASFSAFFGDPFSQTSSGAFTPPSFCLGVFLFCLPSSWDWGQRRIARVFLGSWPSTFLFFLVFRDLFTKTLFFLWKRVILVHFSVSPFRSPWLLSLLCVTLSLSIYLSCFFPSLLSCLCFHLPYFFGCSLLSCFFAFVSWKEQPQNLTFANLIFINYFGVFSWFVFHKYVLIFIFSLFKSNILVHINVFQVFQEDHF